MAIFNSKSIFITTSPRTPSKMIPEIELLKQNFEGKEWNTESQKAFMELLQKEDFFNGQGIKDPAFSARDRINRAPKALGFVQLSPVIKITPAGEQLISAKRKEEVFLRQLLKFQLPSPFHTPGKHSANFCVKPYLEIFRLIRFFGSLKFDELMIFGLQMVDYHQFDAIVDKINKFRVDKAQNKGSYRTFRTKYLYGELKEMYKDEIKIGAIKTRESNDKSLEKFLSTKASNMRDYTDACVRYLRATGMVNISHVGKTLSIIPEKEEEVDYFLDAIDRKPCFVDLQKEYEEYLGDSQIPVLWSDNKDMLLEKMRKEFPNVHVDETTPLQTLKDAFNNWIYIRQQNLISEEITSIKDGNQYDDIQNTFTQIEDNELYDIPLMLEWNVWRAMTMLDGGDIKANLKFDDFGKPMSTAQGNMADIVCDYGDFGVTVEVTTMSGQRQYEMEGEPVSRHLAKQKKADGKPTYCLFVAPTINEASIAHFFMLHRTNISYYGGKSTIIPMELSVFKKMLEDSHKASYIPSPKQVKNFFLASNDIADKAADEKSWYEAIKSRALHWLE